MDVAERNTGQLASLIAQNNGEQGHITSKDLDYSKDVSSGPVAATFRPNSSDPTYTEVTIQFANGAVTTAGLYNMTAFGGPSVWRMAIGSSWDKS